MKVDVRRDLENGGGSTVRDTASTDQTTAGQSPDRVEYCDGVFGGRMLSKIKVGAFDAWVRWRSPR